MELEETSPLQGEPTPAPKAATPEHTDPPPVDLKARARELMAHLNQMVDMMLMVPLASLYRASLALLLPSNRAAWGSTEGGW